MSDPVKIVASPLDDVYKKFEHLDGCLSDPEWCTSGEGAAIYGIAGELWRAVKEARDIPAKECIGRYDECKSDDGCECVAYCIMAANNIRRLKEARATEREPE
jgi:hypothetical protein